jgi:VWFA-related protein
MKRVLIIAAVLGLAGLAAAQEDDVIRVDVNLVNLFFTARDKSGAYLKDLKREDITIFEDGKQQEIKAFTRESNLPLTIGMLIDVSRSQENLIPTERNAGGQFFRQVLKDEDLAFLISYGADIELLQDFTSSARLLEKGLGDLRLSAGFSGLGPIPVKNPKGTVMFDAIYLAAHDQLVGQVGRKVLILITDGADQGSHYKIREAIDEAHRADAIVYSIFYADPQFGGGNPGDLSKISEETGGRMFEVGRNQSLDRIFQAIQEEMRSQYTVAYSSTNTAHDGAFRKIEIRPMAKNTRIQARKGYFAEDDSKRTGK